MGNKAIKFKNKDNDYIYPCPYYPVGSVYISVTEINPSTFFGGTWEQIKDKFLLACGNTYKNATQGGNATKKLSEANLPSRAMVRQSVSGTKYGCGCNTGITNTWANICLNDGGFANSKEFSNMPPYLAVYMWKRTK